MKSHLLFVAVLGFVFLLNPIARAEDHAGEDEGREQEESTFHTRTTAPTPFKSDNSYDLPKDCNGGTYHDFMDKTITPKLKKLAEHPTDLENDVAEEEGKNVRVKLDAHNYNYHVNFPENKQGGRSYGWRDGNNGDWSDKAYLNNLNGVKGTRGAMEGSSEDIKKFFSTVVQMVGSCDTSGLSKLSGQEQQVANNFLAIYTAEEYRAAINNSKWDDALFQVTMLGAFHAGQSKFAKFYDGKFSDKSVDQNQIINEDDPKKRHCAYGKSKEGATFRDAQMNDYWQLGFSVKPKPKFDRKTKKPVLDDKGNPVMECAGTSGINVTRNDFEKMGEAITKFESKDPTMKKIQSIVGNSSNVIAAISQYYTNRKAKVGDTDKLAELVGEFMAKIHDDADKISGSLK